MGSGRNRFRNRQAPLREARLANKLAQSPTCVFATAV